MSTRGKPAINSGIRMRTLRAAGILPPAAKTIQVNYQRPWLYPLQEEAIFYPRDKFGKPARFSWIEAGTKTGKTVGCFVWLGEKAFLGKFNTNYWWIAPTRKQAEIAYTRMKAAYPLGTFHSNDSDLKLTLILNGNIVWFKSAEIPDNLYGEDVWAAVYDEASRGREESWHALRSTLTATRGPVRFIGNVKGRKNWFYNGARKAESGEPGHAYYKIIAADAIKAGILSEQEIADAKRDLPEQIFRELYLAEPSDDGGNPFGLQYIAKCVRPELAPGPAVVYGVDLGKKNDWTVIIGLNEAGDVCYYERFQLPWPRTISRIKVAIGGVPTLVDSTGLGDPILEELQAELGSNVEGYLFSAPSKQKLMEGLAVNIQGNDVGYPDGEIRKELDTFTYEYTRTGVRYTAPEGLHDDCVCSLALAAYHKRHNAGLEVWRRLAS